MSPLLKNIDEVRRSAWAAMLEPSYGAPKGEAPTSGRC